MKKINMALCGHTSVGKTSFLDTLLFNAGAAPTLGKVDDGRSLSDFDEEEVKRKISIHSSIFSFVYRDILINVADTPGSSDFAGEVVCVLHGVESVLLLIDAVSGVEIETGKNWTRAEKMGLPVFIFVNKIDKEHADYKKTLMSIKDFLKIRTCPVQIPIGQESDFKGVVDLINMKAYVYDDSEKKGEEAEIPSELLSEAQELRNEIIEIAAESSDELIEKYLDGEPLTDKEIIEGIKTMILKRQAIPLMYGSCSMNRGITEALDFLVRFAPDSSSRKQLKAHDAQESSKEIQLVCSKENPFTARVFKTVIDQFTGKLSYLRLFSGVLSPDEEVINTTKEQKEKVSKLALPYGKNPKSLARNAEEGDIIVLTKLPHAETGDTLASAENRVVLDKMVLPQPVHSLAIRAKNKKEEDKLNSLIQRAAEEDISFTVKFNSETKQTVISGMGELQINIILSRIKEKYGIDLETTTPLIAYRETLGATAKADYKHKKQTGGHGQYGEVHLEVEPLPRGNGFEFMDKIVGGVIPRGYIPGVEKGVKEAMEQGVVAGYPVVDVRVSLVFGSYHDVDSSELAFKIAGRQAFKLAMEKANPALLEPIMDLNVIVDDKYTGDIMSDLNAKRGRVLGMDNMGSGLQSIKAKVPQAELLKYSIELKSMTSGTGSFDMDFSHYEPIGGKIAEDVIKEIQKRKQEEEKAK